MEQKLPKAAVAYLNSTDPFVVVRQSVAQLRLLHNLSNTEAEYLRETAASRLVDLNTLSLAWNNDRVAPTGNEDLDAFLGGGFLVPGINEVYGPAGSGKTQLVLQLIASSLCADRKALAVYLACKDTFYPERFIEICRANSSSSVDPEDVLKRVLVRHVRHRSELLDTVKIVLPKLAENPNNKVAVVVVDSIAALFRGDEDAYERGVDLRRTAFHLRQVSRRRSSTCVVCVNQVTANVAEGVDQPSLGLVWSNLVTARLRLDRFDDVGGGTQREMCRVFGPTWAPGSCHVKIGRGGLSVVR
jgi:RecA/RadA recombinase